MVNLMIYRLKMGKKSYNLETITLTAVMSTLSKVLYKDLNHHGSLTSPSSSIDLSEG